MKPALSLARSSLFFSAALIGQWIFFAGLSSLTLHFTAHKATILDNPAFIFAAAYFFAARETLAYLTKHLGRLPGSGEYKVAVIISALISIAFQNAMWWAAETPLSHQERVWIAIFVSGSVALGYLDLPPFKFRKNGLE